ncbi:hypothetical protein, partial [Staphylococcus epidermidis]|uniref:hypothetical protein n=1 Tax=Staphylococcus epidermidis TaxID=1282 RepID=UPI0016434F0E
KCLKNVDVGGKEYEGEVIFLDKVKDGGVDDRYGIEVGKLGDLGNEVIDRGEVILNGFEEKGWYEVCDENSDDEERV